MSGASSDAEGTGMFSIYAPVCGMPNHGESRAGSDICLLAEEGADGEHVRKLHGDCATAARAMYGNMLPY